MGRFFPSIRKDEIIKGFKKILPHITIISHIPKMDSLIC